MEKLNQAINLLRPPDLEQRNITGQREEGEKAVLTQHEPVKHTIAVKSAGKPRMSGD